MAGNLFTQEVLEETVNKQQEFLWTAASGPEKKSKLLQQCQQLQMASRELSRSLEKATPAAKQLLVSKELDKLNRQLEKVQMGLQELIL